MMASKKKHICIVGCGNLAWYVAERLRKHYNLSLYNHKPNKALADFKAKFKLPVYTDLEKISVDADVFILCVKDNVIDEVITKIRKQKAYGFILITSGSYQIKPKQKNIAALYPLMSFTKGISTNPKTVPVIYTGYTNAAHKISLEIGEFLGPSFFTLTNSERLKLHLCAVLVNNFTNSLYAEAYRIMQTDKNLPDFNLLLPLIRQGVEKLELMNPIQAQTGPAKRGDNDVMKKHLELMNNSDLKKLYRIFSHLISIQQNKG